MNGGRQNASLEQIIPGYYYVTSLPTRGDSKLLNGVFIFDSSTFEVAHDKKCIGHAAPKTANVAGKTCRFKQAYYGQSMHHVGPFCHTAVSF